MIAVAPIVPTAYLEKVASSLGSVHLLLAHQVLEDVAYRDFYKNRKGDYLILDNSAFELGEALDDEAIIRAIELVQPDEVVLPDVLCDYAKTIVRVEAFLRRHVALSKKGVRFMAVPHGRSLGEYERCYRQLAALPQVHALGIGAVYDRMFGTAPWGRQAIFASLAKNKVLSPKPHHLLGLGDSGHLELQNLKSYQVIRSCDSSAAYVHAAHHVRFQKDKPYTKIKAKVNFHAAFNESIARLLAVNINALQEAAQ